MIKNSLIKNEFSDLKIIDWRLALYISKLGNQILKINQSLFRYGIFNNLIILDIANNHFGSVSHAKRIIDEISKIDNPKNYKVLLKLQFRNLDTFIHPDAPQDSHYVKRFESTKLNKNQLIEIANYISSLDKEKYG